MFTTCIGDASTTTVEPTGTTIITINNTRTRVVPKCKTNKLKMAFFNCLNMNLGYKGVQTLKTTI